MSGASDVDETPMVEGYTRVSQESDASVGEQMNAISEFRRQPGGMEY